MDVFSGDSDGFVQVCDDSIAITSGYYSFSNFLSIFSVSNSSDFRSPIHLASDSNLFIVLRRDSNWEWD